MIGMIKRLCIALLVHVTYNLAIYFITGVASIAQSETFLTTYTCLTADAGVVNSTPAQSHTFAEIDHEIIYILLPSADSKRVLVNQRKYVHEALLNLLVKLAQEKSVVRYTIHLDMTMAIDCDVKYQIKQINIPLGK